MAEATVSPPQGPAIFAPVARSWARVSSSLVPLLAVITAFIAIIPLMILTGADGNVGAGLRLSGTVYSALLEGSTGITINPVLQQDDFDMAIIMAQNWQDGQESLGMDDPEPLQRSNLLRLSGRAELLASLGVERVEGYGDFIANFDALDNEQMEAAGARIADIREIGADRLREFAVLFADLNEQSRGDVRDLAEVYSVLEENSLTDEQRAEIEALAVTAADYDDAGLLTAFDIVDEYGIVTVARTEEQLAILDEAGIDPNGDDADTILEIFELGTDNTSGADRLADLASVRDQLFAAGVTDVEEISNELRLTLRLYETELVTSDDVQTALVDELPASLDENFVVRRPNNRLLVNPGVTDTTAIIRDEHNRPETVYSTFGNSTLLFFPANLESMLTRTIPFVIAGLAVALGFRAGLFNIGAEGQLYIGATMAAWIGYVVVVEHMPGISLPIGAIFGILSAASLAIWIAMRHYQVQSDMQRRIAILWIIGVVVMFLLLRSPTIFHFMLVLVAGVIGGGLWGFIPGVLKAFTGAHEVIVTIMLNFVAIRLVDWLIKSDDPIILLDPSASTPRTPFIAETASLPLFADLAAVWFIGAGVLTAVLMLWARREHLQTTPSAAIRPIVYGLLVTALGYFLQWISIRGNLHIGLVVMVLTVMFVDWFLERTTPGFELRTVGTNPNAAKYAGMSVKWNLVLAMTLSGAIVGLAGTVQISGVQQYMEPTFFAGLGFDAIAVALLARVNPRNMIPAGMLWGALLTGAGLMQERAALSNDLVKIIQALVIMFIAADAIVRYLWRVPEASEEEKMTTFSSGWGG